MSRARPVHTLATGLLLTCCATTAGAQPFGTFDARSAGMAGVGVATGSQYASFNNPALLSTAADNQEWFLLAPTLGRQEGDPDDLEAGLEAFQAAADALQADPTAANRDRVRAELDTFSDGIYRQGGNAALMLAIPSRILSGAAFIRTYDWANARATLGGDDLSDPANPQYVSTLEHRGARVLENGVSAATVLEGRGWRRQMAIGFNAKFLFVEGYGSSEPLRDARVTVNRTQRANGAAFNLDVGVLKEFGVWKLGLMARNLFANSFDYGASGETFEIAPQVRAGFAYQSRRTVIELDIDLVENAAAGFDSPTQEAALGVEYKPWRWLALRTGYRQNMVGTQAGGPSVGLGLGLGPLQVDMAGYRDQELTSVSAQLGLQF